MYKAKYNTSMETKLRRIEKFSNENRGAEFNYLISHFSKENLISSFHELDGKKAMGEDGISKEEYGENLERNIESLVNRMKELKYYPAPVRQVLIPKGNGKYRPLGISNIEDKLVQKIFSKVLTAIYEPLFIDSSHGFRPGRSCHDAIEDVFHHLSSKGDGVVLDVDLSNFFGTIDHRKLIQILELKIKDRTFIRYIVRMLRAGILSNGELKKSNEGTPQGSICSPILANIFAHYAIDKWMTEIVPSHLRGDVHFVRYADDFIICTSKENVPKIMKGLKGRLERFSLIINEEKTKVVSFSRRFLRAGIKQGIFKFLGFCFYLGKSKKGQLIVKIKTDKKTLATKISELTKWCKKNRNKYRLASLWNTFRAKIRGHIQYYGVSHNIGHVANFVYHARKIFFKWMNRRSQKKSFNWNKFKLYEKLKPVPTVKLVHRLF